MARERVLILGGCGFIGSNLVRRLVAQDFHCVVVDSLLTGRTSALPNDPHIDFYKGDFWDTALLRDALKEVSYVIHAATVNITLSNENPELCIASNIAGTMRLFECLRQTHAMKKIIYCSSASVYGNAAILPTPEDAQITTLSHYATAKMTGELYAQYYYFRAGLPLCVVRYSNVYGPGQTPTNPYCGVVSRFFEQLRQGQELHIYGSGEQTRDYTFVDDVVEATVLAMTAEVSLGQTFNIASGKETSVMSLANAISHIVDITPKLIFQSPRGIDGIKRRCLDTSRVLNALGWSAKTNLDDGLRQTKQWLDSQE